jgi:hypothetical protein
MGASGGDKLEILDTTNYTDCDRYRKRIGRGVEHVPTRNYIGKVTAVSGLAVCIDDGQAICFGGFESDINLFNYKYYPPKYRFVSPKKIVVNGEFPFVHRVDKEPKGLASVL